MGKIITFISGYLGVDSVWDVILMIADIAIISFAIYKIVVLLRKTRAFSLLKSIIFIFLAAYVAKLLNLYAVSALLNIILNVLPVMAIVLFAPEIRKILVDLGNKRLVDVIKNFSVLQDRDEIEKKSTETERIIDETVTAAKNMSESKTGAIIVFEMQDDIKGWDKQGTIVDAVVSSRLLEQIFVVNTPLHDAAVIIREGRIYAAQCVLPLTENTGLGRELGTRHRAAVGASESADCLVVVVSEETGVISLAKNGRLIRNLTPENLKTILMDNMLPKQTEARRKSAKRKDKNKDLQRQK